MASNHEIAAHRIRQVNTEEPLCQGIRPAADTATPLTQASCFLAIEITGRHHEIDVTLVQSIEHGREDRFIMLQIRVHHRNVTRLARQHSLDAGTRETTPTNA